MEKIGVETLSLEVLTHIEGDCNLCDKELLVSDESYLFSSDESLIAAYHKDCFWHMAVVMREFFEQHGLPKGANVQ